MMKSIATGGCLMFPINSNYMNSYIIQPSIIMIIINLTSTLTSIVLQRRSILMMQWRRFSDVQTDEWFLFPRQREGNIYVVNWSLVEDGVTPVGDAFRNAELSTLTKKLGSKVQSGKVELSKPLYFGDFILQESGDHISHDEFSVLFTEQQRHLESGISLYVEDAGIGAYSHVRNGVRVIAEDPALALIARNLLVRYIINHHHHHHHHRIL